MLASPDLHQKYLPNPPNSTSKDLLSVKNQQNILNLELLSVISIDEIYMRMV
jgi:hypothetical protein